MSFVIERAVYFLDSQYGNNHRLNIIIERRGKKEDNRLKNHFNILLSRGTYYIEPKRLKDYGLVMNLKDKRENINGLQMADLIAYPIARYVIDKNRANPAFDTINQKFYKKGANKYGLKIFP